MSAIHFKRDDFSQKSRISDIEEIVKTFVREMLGDSDLHGFGHTMRVYNLAMKIAHNYIKKGFKVNLLALKLAALLHDVGRPLERKEKKHHALLSVEIARELLSKLGLESELTEKVCDAIISHSFSSRIRPTSIEAKILSDADKLDAIGAIGISRCFMLAGATGRNIHSSIRHFHEKLLKLKSMLFTEPAKEMAEKRHEFMISFLRQLEEELRESNANTH